MIPVQQLIPSTLRQVNIGDFCIPDDPSRAKMLIGKNQNLDLACFLGAAEGRDAFELLPANRLDGRVLIIRDYVLCVDENSMLSYDQAKEAGDLGLSDNGTFLMGTPGNDRPMPISIAGEPVTGSFGAIWFRKWRLMIGAETAPQVIFAKD